ncbi:hypothetical protein LAV79_17640 [Peribacillus butanolivorans]|uniref:hypothetical protein n=1 Tax=Peribacillus butanolivorans TaxID=421767 RepID=UPI0030C9F7DE
MIEVARYIKIIATKQLIKNLFFDILIAKIKLPLHFQFIGNIHNFHYNEKAMFLIFKGLSQKNKKEGLA